MRLEFGCPVACADAPFGELADVVVDPLTRRVTHLVVQPHGRRPDARLVPIDRARPAETGIALSCSHADVEAMERLYESAYLRVERSVGPFQRLIVLPVPGDSARVTARYAGGVLEVRIPKVLDRRKVHHQIPIE